MKPAIVTAPDPKRGQRRDRTVPAPATHEHHKPKSEHHAPADKE